MSNPPQTWSDLKVNGTPCEWYSTYLNRICEINRKYNFRSNRIRSNEDIAESEKLWIEIRKCDDKWDELNPLSPCPSCNGERKASSNGYCPNFNCPLGVKILGS